MEYLVIICKPDLCNVTIKIFYVFVYFLKGAYTYSNMMNKMPPRTVIVKCVKSHMAQILMVECLFSVTSLVMVFTLFCKEIGLLCELLS